MIVSHLKAITQITHVSNSLQDLVQPLICCQEVIPNKFYVDLGNPLASVRGLLIIDIHKSIVPTIGF